MGEGERQSGWQGGEGAVTDVQGAGMQRPEGGFGGGGLWGRG